MSLIKGHYFFKNDIYLGKTFQKHLLETQGNLVTLFDQVGKIWRVKSLFSVQ